MSVPKSKVLSVSKGMMMLTELKNNSPSQSQTVCVNIQSSPKPDGDRSLNEPVPETVSYSPDQPYQEPNPYADIKIDNEGTIKSLLILIKIIESNPLIVNKIIVATSTDLKELIKTLTSADEVEIVTNYDVDCSCVGSEKFNSVEKIYIKTGVDSLNFKYAFPEAVKFLDIHNVSTKMIC